MSNRNIIYNDYLIRVRGNKWTPQKQTFSVFEPASIARAEKRLFIASFTTLEEAQDYIDAL